MARERKGTIFAGKGGELCVRFTVDVVDATTGTKTTKRETHNLHTYDKRAAQLLRMKLFRELQTKGSLPKETAKDLIKTAPTFKEAAELVLADSHIKTLKGQKQRLASWAYPVIGHLRLDKINSTHFFEMCLEKARDEGKSKQTGTHLKNDLSKVWRLMHKKKMVPSTLRLLALDAELPEGFAEDGRERAVLTDDELDVYCTWVHHSAKRHVQVLERQVKCCLARLLGGSRTSELHRLQWTHFEMENGEFVTCRLRRSKTKGPPQRLEVPTMASSVLADWWIKAGKPETGFLFPKVKGEVGEQRSKTSLADALRRDLARAFGLEVYDPKEKSYVPNPQAKWTQRQIALLKGTDEYLPVDFHSGRRAFCQAVDNSDASETDKKGLSNHATESARKLYLRNGGKAIAFPEGALPVRPLRLGPPVITVEGVTVATEPAGSIAGDLNDSSELAQLRAEFGSSGTYKRRMGRLFKKPRVSKIPGKSETETAPSVQVSGGFGPHPADFQSAESERLAGKSESKNIEKNDGPISPDNSVLNVSPRLIRGGADAMNQGVLLLTKLMTEALEAGNWDQAEQLGAQLSRVIAIRTQTKKRASK